MTCFQLPGSGGYENWKMEYDKPVGGRHQHILDDPVVFNYTGPKMNITINGGGYSQNSGNFWTGLMQGLTGYNKYGMKTGFGIFDLGFAFLARGLMGKNKGTGLFNTNNFWSNPSLYNSGMTGMDTFDRAHTWIQPGLNQYTPTKKTTETEEPDKKKKTTTETEEPGNKKKTTTTNPDVTPVVNPGNGLGSTKAEALKTFNAAIAGDTPGITHNTKKDTYDVKNAEGTDNVFAGLPSDATYPAGTSADSKKDGFQQFFYETDSSGNQYAYQYYNYDKSTGRLYYKFYESGSHINSNWKLNEKFNVSTNLEVMIQDGTIKVINNTTEPIAIPKG